METDNNGPEVFLTEMERIGAMLHADYERMQGKAAAAQAEADASREKWETWERAKSIWLDLHPGVRLTPGRAAALFERFRTLKTRDMLIELARSNRGILRVDAAAERLAASGLFRDKRNAARNISVALFRADDVFERVQRGSYRLAEEVVGTAN